MPSFSTQIHKHSNGRSLRPLVYVLIGDASKIPDNLNNKQESQQKLPQIPVLKFTGLVDTGATMTCITKNVAEKLKTTPLGTAPMTSASHRRVYANIYRLLVIVAIDSFPPTNPPTTEKQQPQPLTFPMSQPSILQASEFVNSGKGDIDVLIGMDIIQKSVFTITGHDNRLTMSF